MSKITIKSRASKEDTPLIAALLRHCHNDYGDMSDREVINTYGGDKINKIVYKNDNVFVYHSFDDYMTVETYTLVIYKTQTIKKDKLTNGWVMCDEIEIEDFALLFLE